ncbi:hypothetical protein I316_03644 [Kwoniella heveanensis BCC8398]|uniref:Uncharacterized protein n=1 Tax=Kwoniella heveanensis BCC8398 TaxID=1296120 RepID=A0A1B9GU81_9TREE|nr:hypothetical protein I316_03644 [Kwoniella heveanensis BCC8398]
MFTATILFSVLFTLVNAAPLPMPAVKQSEQLASRFYNHAEPINYHQTPCWENGLQGVLRDDVCILANLDVDGTRYPQAYPYRPATYAQGEPCTLNGRQGFWRDAICVLADVDVNLKRNFYPGQECWFEGRRGYFQQDGLCNLLDLDLDVVANDAPAVLNNGGLPTALPAAGNPCWLDGRQGYWRDNLCILADLDLAKRFVPHSDGLVSDVLETLTGYEDCINCPPGFNRHAVLPTDHLLDADALVDVDRSAARFPYKRNGLIHNAPDGNELDGAVRTVTQLLDHSVTKRGLLGINDLPVLDGQAQRYPYYPNGYRGAVTPEVVGSVVDVDADVDVDAGDEPYYGAPHHDQVLNGGLLPLKRDILGNGDDTLNVLTSIGDVLNPNAHGYHHPTGTRYVPTSNGNLVPVPVSNDVLATVEAAVDIGSGSDYQTVGRYPYGDRRVFGEFIPRPAHGVAGLLGRNLGGLSGVNGLGLNKDGSFPEGLDAVPALGDILGAGKVDDLAGKNPLSKIL